MFALQTSSASRSVGAEVEACVIGGSSRPHERGAGPSKRARIGPPNAPASGWRSAPSTSARSQPGGAHTSSSTSAIRSRPRSARSRCCAPRSARCGVVAGAPSAPPARSITSGVESLEPSSTTIISYSPSRSWAASERERHLQVIGPVGRRNHHGYQGFRHAARLACHRLAHLTRHRPGLARHDARPRALRRGVRGARPRRRARRARCVPVRIGAARQAAPPHRGHRPGGGARRAPRRTRPRSAGGRLLHDHRRAAAARRELPYAIRFDATAGAQPPRAARGAWQRAASAACCAGARCCCPVSARRRARRARPGTRPSCACRSRSRRSSRRRRARHRRRRLRGLPAQARAGAAGAAWAEAAPAGGALRHRRRSTARRALRWLDRCGVPEPAGVEWAGRAAARASGCALVGRRARLRERVALGGLRPRRSSRRSPPATPLVTVPIAGLLRGAAAGARARPGARVADDLAPTRCAARPALA